MERGSTGEHMVAGALSALVNCVSLQPLDLIKTRLQQQNNNSNAIHQQKQQQQNMKMNSVIREVMRSPQGIWGFWRGTWATCIRNVPGVAMYFGTLQFMRRECQRSLGQEKLSPVVNLMCGASGRVAVGLILMPFTVIKSRLESSLYRYEGVCDAWRQIYRGEGWRGFFYGFGSTALRDAPYAGLYILIYDLSKSLFQIPLGASWSTILLTGASGCMATVVTHPFDVIRTRIQLRPRHYRNTVNCVRVTLAEDGIRGFGAGMMPRIMRKSLSAMITWTLYEELVLLLSSSSSSSSSSSFT